MNAKDAKPGMKLVVVDGCPEMPNGTVVTVSTVPSKYEQSVRIVENFFGNDKNDEHFYSERFEPAPAPKQFKRAKNGRFASDAQGPIRLTPPAGLRNGQIYAVERKRGTTIARLKYQFDDNVVMLSHNQPFLAKRGKVKLANVTEVQEYLKK